MVVNFENTQDPRSCKQALNNYKFNISLEIRCCSSAKHSPRLSISRLSSIPGSEMLACTKPLYVSNALVASLTWFLNSWLKRLLSAVIMGVSVKKGKSCFSNSDTNIFASNLGGSFSETSNLVTQSFILSKDFLFWFLSMLSRFSFICSWRRLACR